MTRQGSRPVARRTPFGLLLDQDMRKAGLTRVELAERLGVKPQQVSQWRNGTGGVTIPKLVALSEVFGWDSERFQFAAQLAGCAVTSRTA